MAGGGCGKKSAGPSGAEAPRDANYFFCERDLDCVAAPADCCGCLMGGKNAAVNRALADSWERTMADQCKGTACAAVVSDDASCQAAPKCVEGRCGLTGPSQENLEP